MKRISRYWRFNTTELSYLTGFLMVMAVIPLFLPETLLFILGLTFIFIVFSISWDFMTGLVGEVNLGHTIFIGIGGYVTALLNVPSRFESTILNPLTDLSPLPIPLTILLGGIIAAIFGVIIGLITLRLKGWYFALVTAILPLLFIKATYVLKELFGGEEGFSIGLGRAIAQDTLGKYIATLVFMAISFVILYGIKNSKLGLTLIAIREDNTLAESLGINIYLYKVFAMGISSFFAGLSGALLVHYRITVSPDLFDIPLMLLIILAVVIGGLGSIIGPVIGGFLIYILKYWVLKVYLVPYLPPTVPINDDIILYILLILIAVTMPHGIYDRLRKLYLEI